MKKFTVDRIEGELAVLECENGSFVEMELASLPKNIREGDIIRFDANRFIICHRSYSLISSHAYLFWLHGYLLCV